MKHACLLGSLLWIAACGSVDTPVTVDAAEVPSPDASLRGEVSITVLDTQTAAPLDGRHVLFLEADGTLAADEVVDVDGHAAAEVGPGATVVLIYELDAEAGAVYYFGVNPGDALRFGGYNGVGTATLALTFPTRAGADDYDVLGSCAGGTVFAGTVVAPPIALTNLHCAPGDTLDVVVRARDAGNIVATLAVTDETFAPTLTIGGTYRTPQAFAADVTGLPAAVTDVSATMAAEVGVIDITGVSTSVAPVNGTASFASASFDDIPGSRLRSSLSLSRADLGPLTVYDNRAFDGTSATIAADDLAPWASGPVQDYATGTLAWSEIGGGSADTFFVLTGVPDGSNHFVYAGGPLAGASSFTFPPLPPAYSAFSMVGPAPMPGSISLLLLKMNGLADAAQLDPISIFFGIIQGTLARGVDADVTVSYSNAASN